MSAPSPGKPRASNSLASMAKRLLIAGPLLAASAYGALADDNLARAQIVATSEIPEPGYLQSAADPAFGTPFTRVTDPGQETLPRMPCSQAYCTHRYSSSQAWNADQSLLVIANGCTGLCFLDGRSYEPLFERPFFAELKASHHSLGSSSNFVQLHVQAEKVFHMGRKWHLLLRDEAGATLVSGFSQLPTVYRFFAGGDNSVRAFSYNALSPLDPAYTTDARTHLTQLTYIKVGGKDVITGTVEVIRDLPRNFGVAAFFDYGNAFNRFGTPFIAHGSNCRTPLTLEPAPAPPPASPPNGLCLEYSVGVGFRVRLPVMTLGVDIAKPLSRSAGPRLHINFSPKL